MKTYWGSGCIAPRILDLGTRCVEILQLQGRKWNRDCSVGIALGYGLDDLGSRVRFPARAGNFSLHHRVQNGSGAHLVSYLMSTRNSFPVGKAAGAWSWPLTSIYSRDQRMSGAIHPFPQYTFMAWCLFKAQLSLRKRSYGGRNVFPGEGGNATIKF
jgi:hypothetical protein